MTTAVDVVVVGAGIAGASLARALSLAGLGVTVLEDTDRFPDPPTASATRDPRRDGGFPQRSA